MPVSVTYVGATQFEVAGNQTKTLPRNRLLEAVQGTNALVAVAGTLYQSGDDTTLVTVTPSVLTSDLTGIRPGPTFADLLAGWSNIGPHGHTAFLDGGDIPASGLTDNEVANLQSLPKPTTGDDSKLVAVVVGATGFEFVTLNGTANQIIVTNGTGVRTLSLPQNINTAATPTFAGMTLSALTGVLCGKGSSAVVAINPTAGLQVLRQDVTDTFLEFAGIKWGELLDVDDAVSASPAAGDMYYYDGSTNKIKRIPAGTNDQVLTMESGTPTWKTGASAGGANEATVWFYSALTMGLTSATSGNALQ